MKNGIFKDYLAAVLKEARVAAYYADKDHKVIGFTPDGSIGYFCKTESFPFKLSDGESNIFADFYKKGLQTSEDAISLSGEMRIITIKGKQTEVVRIGNKWINKKLLKHLESGSRFTGPDDASLQPVYVWEGNNLVAFIMPTRVKEDK